MMVKSLVRFLSITSFVLSIFLFTSSKPVLAIGSFYNWTLKGHVDGTYGYKIASSADGTKLVTTAYTGYLYTSTDSGPHGQSNGVPVQDGGLG